MKSRIRFSVPYIVVRAFVLAIVIAAGLSSPMSAMAQTTPRTLVAVLAHPDDEGRLDQCSHVMRAREYRCT